MKPYYADESVTLYHGDCREITAWLDADVLVTDPPYGIKYVGGGPRVNAFGVRSMTTVRIVQHDETTETRDAALSMWGDRPAIVFGSWRSGRPAGTRQRLIWHKRNTNPGLGTATPWSSADEEIYVLGSGFTGKREQNILVTDESRASGGGLAALTGHPTPKPVGLMERLIAHCPGGTVADPFAGSGATLMAAQRQGRKAIGVEIHERYCELIARRLDQGVLPLTPPGVTVTPTEPTRDTMPCAVHVEAPAPDTAQTTAAAEEGSTDG